MNKQDPPKEELAKIRAEVLVRYDDTIEAYEILQLTCELLSERAKMMASVKECPQDLIDSVATLIWASNVIDIPELIDVRKLFKAKYGAKFIDLATNNQNGNINERVVQKLSITPPTAFIVQTYLERIAEQFEIHWVPSVRLQPEDLCRPMAAPTGYSVMTAPGTGLVSSSMGTTTVQKPPSVDVDRPQAESRDPINSDIAIATPVLPLPSLSRPSYAPLYTPLPDPDIAIGRHDVLLYPNTGEASTTSSSLQVEQPSNDEMSDLQRRLAQLQHRD